MKKKYRILFSFLLFFIASYVAAIASEYSVIHVLDKKDLRGEQFYTTFQDSKGFLWFGTDMGVIRFDGRNCTYFTSLNGLPDNTVFGFFEDSYGRLWCRTFSGQICFIYKDKVYSSASLNTTLRNKIGSTLISSLYVENNKIYFGRIGGPPFSIS